MFRGRMKKTVSEAILCLAIALVGGILSSCCVKSAVEIENPQSPLPAALAQESDFSPGWRWLSVYTSEELVKPTTENGHTVDRAMRSFTGYYSSVYYVNIIHLLVNRSQTVSLSTLDLEGSSTFSGGEEFSVETPSLGGRVISKCASGVGTNNSTICQVVVGYNCISSGLTIDAPDDLATDDIELMISEALLGADTRIREIDCSSE